MPFTKKLRVQEYTPSIFTKTRDGKDKMVSPLIHHTLCFPMICSWGVTMKPFCLLSFIEYEFRRGVLWPNFYSNGCSFPVEMRLLNSPKRLSYSPVHERHLSFTVYQSFPSKLTYHSLMPRTGLIAKLFHLFSKNIFLPFGKSQHYEGIVGCENNIS